MRLPVIGNISTKDGATNKNARLTNMLAEQKKNGTTLATVRPGLSLAAQTTGNGNGIVCFGGDLINIFGSAMGYPVFGEYRYDTTTSVISDVIIDGVKFGSNYIVRSEQAIYTGASIGSLTYYDPDGLAYYAGMPVAGDSICLAMYTDENDDSYIMSWDSGMSLTVTAYQAGMYSPKTFGKGKFVANAENTKTATSTDGLNWTLGPNFTLPSGVTTLYGKDIRFNGSTFCMIAFDDAIIGDVYSYSSVNGLNWSGPSLVRPAMYISRQVFSEIYGHGFICAYDGYCKISVDGGTWIEHELTDAALIPYKVGHDRTSGLICLVGSIPDVYPTFTYHTTFSADNGVTWMASLDTTHYSAIVPTGGGFALFKNPSNVNVISNITNLGEMTSIDSVEDSPIDFALIP